MSGVEGSALYAFALGLVGALNPCGFPLLPAYLSSFVGSPSAPVAARVARGLSSGGLASIGFVGLFGLLGLLVESGVHLLFGWVPYVMIPFGCVLFAGGIAQLTGRLPSVRLPRMRLAGSKVRPLAATGFGISYGVASLSCALPLFVAGVAGVFTRAGAGAGVEDFVAYGIGMGLFLTAAAVATAIAGPRVLGRIRPSSRFIPKASGVLLALVGAYLVYSWTYALTEPLATPFLVRVVDDVQSALSGWLASSARWAGALLGTAVVAAIVFTAFSERSPARAGVPSAPSGSDNAHATERTPGASTHTTLWHPDAG